MKGSETRLLKFMEGSDKRFVIPIYQRSYDWKIENCRQLYDDLIKIIKSGRKSHFFGSIVSVYNPDGHSEEFQIIDGQQRLTTVSLLLLAMCNLLREGKIQSEDPHVQPMIYNKFLVDEWADSDSKIKLKPIKNDRLAYEKLFDDEEETDRWSNITTNYSYFYSRIQKEEISVDDLYTAVFRLEIILIRLSQEDDPQLIFESLNSTGLDLTEGDKIRNYVLMDLDTRRQNEFYEKYWVKIEACTQHHIDLFARDFLSLKTRIIPSMGKIYFRFKEYVEEQQLDTETLLQEMLEYARYYQILITARTDTPRLSGVIQRLNFLETTVLRPFLMEVLQLHARKEISTDELCLIFETAESYVVRRQFCELSPNALNKAFVTLNRDVLRFDGTAARYVEKLNWILIHKKDRNRFPDNSEFSEAVRTRQVYKMPSRNKAYILERLENAGTKEDIDVYRHLENGDYTIEHIMPQKLSDAWKEELGPDYQEIHETWLHRLANLTLTGYNSRYSNASFKAKKEMENGFADSGIRLNHWIASREDWGVDEMAERSRILTRKALSIWPYPRSRYVPPVTEAESCTLADNPEQLVGTKPTRYSLRSEEVPVKSWSELMISVLQKLYREDPAILNTLADSQSMRSKITSDPSSLLRPEEIVPHIYIEKVTDTLTKIAVLRKVFELYQVDPDDLVFYIITAGRKKSDIAEREFNLKFWNYAGSVIEKMNEDEGLPFSIRPTESQEINIRIAKRYFYLRLFVRQSGIRAELSLDDADAINKAQFDALYEHKEEIERSVGQPLVWDRGDNKKVSRIYIALPDASYKNENEWRRIAEFFGKWTALFWKHILEPFHIS